MRKIPVLAVAALALLSACGGEQIVTVGRTVASQDVSALASGARVAEVHGQPPDGASADAVAATLRVPGFRNDKPFTAIPAASPGLRMVLEFGVSPGTNASCQQPRGAALSGPVTMAATLCRDRYLVSSATLRSDSLRGPSDPKWQAAMDRLMMIVLERERKNHLRD